MRRPNRKEFPDKLSGYVSERGSARFCRDQVPPGHRSTHESQRCWSRRASAEASAMDADRRAGLFRPCRFRHPAIRRPIGPVVIRTRCQIATHDRRCPSHPRAIVRLPHHQGLGGALAPFATRAFGGSQPELFFFSTPFSPRHGRVHQAEEEGSRSRYDDGVVCAMCPAHLNQSSGNVPFRASIAARRLVATETASSSPS